MTQSMADIAQLVRALVCGTKCRRFESGYPPHYKTPHRGVFFILCARQIVCVQRLRSAVGFGTWRGGTDSWGESRARLGPSKETQTYGRDDFSIHGGWNLGSAGCIDMTGQTNAFTSWLESTGKDLIVHVKY